MSTHEQDISLADDEDLDEIILTIGLRALRSCGYAINAALLTSAITYGIPGRWALVGAIGLFGMFTSSAKIGQAGLVVLLALAIISPDVVQTFLH